MTRSRWAIPEATREQAVPLTPSEETQQPRTTCGFCGHESHKRWCGDCSDGPCRRATQADYDVAADYKAGRDGLVETHEPGDHHRYRIECEVCGERGTIRLSVDPDLAAGSTPEPTRWKYDSKCEVTDEDHERGEACQGSMPHSHRSGKIKWARLLATPSDTRRSRHDRPRREGSGVGGAACGLTGRGNGDR